MLGREESAKWSENPKEPVYIYRHDRRLHGPYGNYKLYIKARRKPHPKKKEGPDSRSMGQTSRRGNSERGSWGYPSPSRILEPWWRWCYGRGLTVMYPFGWSIFAAFSTTASFGMIFGLHD